MNAGTDTRAPAAFVYGFTSRVAEVENHLARGYKGRIGPRKVDRVGFDPVVKAMVRDAAD